MTIKDLKKLALLRYMGYPGVPEVRPDGAYFTFDDEGADDILAELSMRHVSVNLADYLDSERDVKREIETLKRNSQMS